MLFIPSLSGPFHVGQSFGSEFSGNLCMMSEPRRWGSFWRMHVLNSCSHVCRSVMFSFRVLMVLVMASSCSWKTLAQIWVIRQVFRGV